MTERKRRGRKQSGSRRFAQGMLIYALAVIALILAAMRPFWNYIAAYEDSKSASLMDRYVASFDAEQVQRLAGNLLAGIDPQLQTREQAVAELEKGLGGPLRYALKSASADLMHETYVIRSDARVLGTVQIGKEPDPAFGFSPWEVEEENFDFSFLLDGDEIAVPEGWTVQCNGVTLDESYRSGESLPYETLEAFYGDSRFDLPRRQIYRVERVLGEAPFTLLDRNGQPVDPSELNEWQMLANCTAEESEQLTRLLDGFLQRYIDCLSNVSRNALANYEALKPYVAAGSDIDVRVRDNIQGQQWAHSKGDQVLDRTDHLLMNLGGGWYLADLSYTLDTVGNQGHVESVNQMRVLISRTADGLRVAEVYTY